jgi:hypothetical protein
MGIKYSKLLILSSVLYGCGTWALTLREEYRGRVFENRMLRIGGSKRLLRGDWRNFNEDLHNFYSSLYVICMVKVRRLRCSRHL